MKAFFAAAILWAGTQAMAKDREPDLAGTQSGLGETIYYQILEEPAPKSTASSGFTSDSYALRKLGRGEAHLTGYGWSRTVEQGIMAGPSVYDLRELGRAESHRIDPTLAGTVDADTPIGSFCSVALMGRDC